MTKISKCYFTARNTCLVWGAMVTCDYPWNEVMVTLVEELIVEFKDKSEREKATVVNTLNQAGVTVDGLNGYYSGEHRKWVAIQATYDPYVIWYEGGRRKEFRL